MVKILMRYRFYSHFMILGGNNIVLFLHNSDHRRYCLNFRKTIGAFLERGGEKARGGGG